MVWLSSTNIVQVIYIDIWSLRHQLPVHVNSSGKPDITLNLLPIWTKLVDRIISSLHTCYTPLNIHLFNVGL